jgi:hypothetical protein
MCLFIFIFTFFFSPVSLNVTAMRLYQTPNNYYAKNINVNLVEEIRDGLMKSIMGRTIGMERKFGSDITERK